MSNSEITSITEPEETIDISSEHLGEYNQEILIDKKKLKKIQNEGFSLSGYSGFDINLFDKLGIKPRKHHLYYGINLQEKALETSMTSNEVMIPLISKKDIEEKLQKIKPEIRRTLGWIHIGAIQIIVKSTFREGLDTPIDLALMDYRIRNKKEACLGILRGNLRYRKLKFNLYPRISYNLQDQDFDKTLSLIQDFKRKEFFTKYNRPYSITYMISYAISNSHHSDSFAIKDTIDYPYLFGEVSKVQFPIMDQIREINDIPLKLDLQEKPLIGSTSNYIPRLSFTENSVTTISSLQRTNTLPRHQDLSLTTTKRELKNYKITGEYFDGIHFQEIGILIDTGANGNYIHSKLCINLQKYPLQEPHRYTNFNGEIHEISMAIETILKFGIETIPIRLLIEDNDTNNDLDIMLGFTFLENVKPYQITQYGLKITHNGKIIYIPK